MFAAEWRWKGVWHSFRFLAWDLIMQPRTYIWISNQFICIRACACISNLNYAHKCIKRSIIAYKCPNKPDKFQNLTQHSYFSILTLEKNWNEEEATDIISSPKEKRSVPNASRLLWEALVCEKPMPKPAPNGTKNLPRHVDAAPW